MGLKLYRETGKGGYLTLAGAGIMLQVVREAILEAGADPSDVVLKVRDGSMGAVIDIMFPTPHTFLFDGLHIGNKDGADFLAFVLGGNNSRTTEDKHYAIPLANPNIVQELVKAIQTRAKKHRKTRTALDCS
jgi:hypothetical protein